MSYLFAFYNAKVQLYFGLCKIKVDNSEIIYKGNKKETLSTEWNLLDIWSKKKSKYRFIYKFITLIIG